MGFCPYLKNLYEMQRDISYTDEELDFDDSLDFEDTQDFEDYSDFEDTQDLEELQDIDRLEADWYDGFGAMTEAVMRQADPAEVERIFGLLNSQFEYLYRELERFGLNRFTIAYLFRYIVSYTSANQKTTTGEPEQRATALLNELRRSSPWIIYIPGSYGVPEARMNQIVRTLIAFTLSNIEAVPQVTPPAAAAPGSGASPAAPAAPAAGATAQTLEQRATRITNLLRLQTNIFGELQNLGVYGTIANSAVRDVVLFVLRNTTSNQPPSNIQARTAELLRALESSNEAMIRNLLALGVPPAQLRSILTRIISFALININARD